MIYYLTYLIMEPRTPAALKQHIEHKIDRDKILFMYCSLFFSIIFGIMTIVFSTLLNPWLAFIGLIPLILSSIGIHYKKRINAIDQKLMKINPNTMHEEYYDTLQELYCLYDQYKQSSLFGRFMPSVAPWMLNIVAIRRAFRDFKLIEAQNRQNAAGRIGDSRDDEMDFQPGDTIWKKLDNTNYQATYKGQVLPENWIGCISSEYTPIFLT